VISSATGPAINITSGGGATVTNAGTLSGGNGISVQFCCGLGLLTLLPGSVLNGDVVGNVIGPGTNTAVLQGATVTGPIKFINFDVINSSGTFAPGNLGLVGASSITGGAYSQQAAGTLAIDHTTTTASKLTVSGTATLAGTLLMRPIAPARGSAAPSRRRRRWPRR